MLAFFEIKWKIGASECLKFALYDITLRKSYCVMARVRIECQIEINAWLLAITRIIILHILFSFLPQKHYIRVQFFRVLHFAKISNCLIRTKFLNPADLSRFNFLSIFVRAQAQIFEFSISIYGMLTTIELQIACKNVDPWNFCFRKNLDIDCINIIINFALNPDF